MPKPKARPSEKISPGSIAKPSNKISNKELIAFLRTKFFGPLKRHLKHYLPYLRLAHKRFAQPGRRIPIPGRPLWSEFCRKELGVHVRTVQLWLAEDKPKPQTDKFRDKYDSVDIAHLERIARAAQKLADDNPDEPAFDPIRKAIREKPSGFVIRDGRLDVRHNKFYEGNKKDGKHYHLTPADDWKDIQRRYPGIVDICPHPRPEEYDALKLPNWYKMNYANIPFGTTIEPDGTITGPTAWARKGIEEQEKGNSTVYRFPVDVFFYLLLKAGAQLRPIGRVNWVAIEDGSSQPSGRNIVEIFLPGKEVA